MNNENVSPNEDKSSMQDERNDKQPLPFHNPLKPGDDKQVTQEDIENEQKYKEALSERD